MVVTNLRDGSSTFRKEKEIASMSNRIVIPANYTVDVVIKYDPVSGQTELQVRNRSKITLKSLQIAALLLEHGTTMLRGIVQGTLEVSKAATNEPQPPANGGEHAS